MRPAGGDRGTVPLDGLRQSGTPPVPCSLAGQRFCQATGCDQLRIERGRNVVRLFGHAHTLGSDSAWSFLMERVTSSAVRDDA